MAEDLFRASVCSVGQTLLSVRGNFAAAHADRQPLVGLGIKCLSHRTLASSGLFFFSTRKFVAQVGAHAIRKTRELQQIFDIALEQIRHE